MPFATINPATGKTEKEFPLLTPVELDALVQRAADAFVDYKKTTYAERARHLITAAELLEGEVPAVAHVMTTEMGKTFASAKAEVAKCAMGLRWFAEHAERSWPTSPSPTAPEILVNWQPWARCSPSCPGTSRSGR